MKANVPIWQRFNMISKWGKFYNTKLSSHYLTDMEKRYNPFISVIKNKLKSGLTVIEAGSGTGNITKLLMEYKSDIKYIGLDNNTEMLKLSEINTDNKLTLEKFDIRNKYGIKADIIHSHGVLEHLSVNDIKKTVSNQLSICNTLIHYVPTSGYDYKSYGDELLISPLEWVNICKPDKIITFNNNKDLILIWKKQQHK